MPLDRLEYYREVRLNGKIYKPEDISGEITIEVDQGKVSLASISLFNDTELPIIVNPRKDSITMINQDLEIRAGYHRGVEQIRTLFKGIITNAGLNHPDGSRAVATFEAMSYGYKATTIKRDEVYPVVGRETVPLKDSDGKVAREEVEADSRNWAVVATGGTLSLELIVTKIAEANGFLVESVLVDDIHFDGIDSVLFQKEMTDWQFLQHLAEKYTCNMHVDIGDDPKTELNEATTSGRFYFVKKESLENETVTTLEDASVDKQIEFYYHRNSPANPVPLTPRDRMDPTLEDAALPIVNTSYSFDASSVKGGLISQSYDVDGNLVLTTVVTNEDGGLSYEKLVLREDKLNTPEAQAFVRDYGVGTTTWEDTKQFWKTVDVQVTHVPVSRNNPPVYGDSNLSFDTYGSIYMVPLRTYPVHNMGFGDSDGEDVSSFLCVGLVFTLGDTFRMTVKMLAF